MSGEPKQCACGNITVAGAPATHIKTTGSHARHSFDLQSPVLQIHKSSISVANFSQLSIETVSNRQVDVTCLECGYQLTVYASRNGAFCQFREPTFSVTCGSLPPDSFFAKASPSVVPRSLRMLFKHRDADLFDFGSDDKSRDGSLAPGSQENDSADYDLLFSNASEPLVGSYTEVGQFTTENDYLLC